MVASSATSSSTRTTTQASSANATEFFNSLLGRKRGYRLQATGRVVPRAEALANGAGTTSIDTGRGGTSTRRPARNQTGPSAQRMWKRLGAQRPTAEKASPTTPPPMASQVKAAMPVITAADARTMAIWKAADPIS